MFRNGTLMPLGVAFVQETTVFREFGPLAGSTMRLAYDVAPKIGGTAVAPDLRRRRPPLPAARRAPALLAMRVRGFKSIGDFPDFIYFGGNSEMRGYDYLQFVGQNVVFANAELRFPLIEAALTPIGVIGGIRGVFFANIGGGWFNDQPSRQRARAATGTSSSTNDSTICQPVTGVDTTRPDLRSGRDQPGIRSPIYGPPQTGRAASGCRTAARRTASASRPSRSASRSTSTGRGARCSTRTGKTSLFAADGGSEEFRKPRFAVWIGYDF